MVEENKVRALDQLKARLLQAFQPEDNESQADQTKTFLEESQDVIAEKVILTSFPRSGNTLLRSHLEKLTSIYTGSDCDLKRPLNRQLKEMGLDGEGKLDNDIWIIKTHYPERVGRQEFIANKSIVIVRNPLDAIFSLFNMVGTTSHSESLADEVLELAKEVDLFTEFIRQETSVWYDFHAYWQSKSSQIPVHFITYEAL